MTEQHLLSFIASSIRSVWGLELLLLLKRQPDRVWPPDELVRELRASTTVVSESLQAFEKAGLVRRQDGGYVYAPASTLLLQLCDRLDMAYRERPVAVINAIASPKAKLQGFADAFRLKDDSE